MSTMRLVYDLGGSPPTYDFATTLCVAELERIKRKATGIEVIFLPGPREGFRPNEAWPPKTSDREALMQNIVLPMCRLLPTVTNVVRWKGPEEELKREFGYKAKLYGLPAMLGAMRMPGARALRFTGRAPACNDLITITLREAEHWPQRNSNIKEWLEAARALRADGWHVVVLRDAHRAAEPFEDFEIAPEASINVYERARLYTMARGNLFVNNGPAALALFMDLPAIIFRAFCDTHPASSRRYMADNGLKFGAQFPNTPVHQRWLWEDDTAARILEEVRSMIGNAPAA